MTNRPGIADHAANPPGLLDNPAVRTLLQGVCIDVTAAICLVVVQATDSDHVDWRVLGLLVAKTGVYTLASSIMKRVRPARPEEPSSPAE